VQFSVRFYEAPDGTKPIDVFLQELRSSDPVLHKLLTAGLLKIRDSRRHGPPLTKIVDKKHDIFELRVGNKDIARAFFFFRRGQEIMITNGYVKKTQQVDQKELKKAQQFKVDWETRFP
jgi:phage-related protein